ncbi:MAG: hypothetical protein Q8M15_01880 [Bacteroidota bacterium]|nr:hypothetical protein [Bacteroidota bacterium]
MLFLIAYFIFVFVLLFVYGVLPFVFLKQVPPRNPFVGFVLGFAVLGFMSILFWVGGPVNFLCFWVTVLGAVVALWMNREYYLLAFTQLINWVRQQALFEKALIGLLLIVILYQSAQAPKINDMGMYYLQTMQWMHSYGLVHGLANLHPALGLGSAWHSLVVLLDPFSIGLGHFWQLNGVLLYVFILFCWFEIKQYASVYLWIVFIISIPVSFMYLTAPSPDLPVLLLSGILFYTVWFLTDKIHWFTLLLLCVFIFACKPPAFLAVLMAFVVFISIVKSAKKRILFIFFGLLLCSLVLYKNYILSGYLLYPYSKPDIMDVSWKVPADWNAAYTKGIVSWGLRDKWDLGDKGDLWGNYGGNTRLWVWLTRLGYKGFMNKLIFLNFLLGLVNLFLGLKAKKIFSKDYLVLIAILFIQIIEWLMLSQYRLMLPGSLVLVGFNFYLIVNSFKIENSWLTRFNLSFKPLVVYALMMFYGLALIPFSVFSKGSRNKTITRLDGFNSNYLIEPYKGFVNEKMDSIIVDSMNIYYYPNQTYCWDCAIPCVSNSHRKFLFNNFEYTVKPLGTRVSEGFMLIK